jgi:hypothetical protein
LPAGIRFEGEEGAEVGFAGARAEGGVGLLDGRGFDDAVDVLVGAGGFEEAVDAADDGAVVAAALELQLEDLVETNEGIALKASVGRRATPGGGSPVGDGIHSPGTSITA